MGFLKRLFSRPESPAARDKHPPEVAAPTEASVGKLTIPPGHHVTKYCPTFEPGIDTTNGGTLIANLGAASDKFQEELLHLADEIERLVSAKEPEVGTADAPILLPADASQIHELFAPNDVKVNAIHGLLLWVVHAGSAHLWLRDPEPLLEAIRRAGTLRFNADPITQIMFLSIELLPAGASGKEAPSLQPPPGTLEFARLLSESGASVAAVPDDGVFFIEVCRPDCVLSSLRTAPLPEECTTRPASYFVARAPRLRRLTLAAIEEPTQRTRNQLFEELLSREIALLVMSDRDGRVSESSWPEIGQALPVYPDTSSLFRAAEDLKIPQDSFTSGHFSPRNLFTWVDKEPFGGIALNTYKDRHTPGYLFITKDEIFALARGRIPEDSGG